jgi:hypothetical protein
MREKSAVKKTKVYRALKIHTSSDSGETPMPKETLAPEKEALVEKDQNTSAEGDGASGPKEDPLPGQEPLVEDQNADAEGKQDDVQKDNTTLMEDAPNADKKKNDSLTNSDAKDKEVSFILFPQLYFFLEPLTVLIDLSFCICRMSRRKRLPKHMNNKAQRRYHSLLQIKIKLMKTRALKMMDPTKLMVRGSNQKRPMRRQEKGKEMCLRLALITAMLRICQRS